MGRALEGLRSDHAAPPGVLASRSRTITVYRALEDLRLLACQRQAEGLQAECRGHGGVQENFPARVADVRTKLAPGTPIEVWCQDEMRVGQKDKLTYRWARKGSRPRIFHDQRTQSTYLFGAVLPGTRGRRRPRCCRPATARPCSFISMRSQPGHARRARDRPPRSSRVAWRQGAQGPEQHLSDAAAAPRTRTQRPGKHLSSPRDRTGFRDWVFKSFDDIVDHCCYAWTRSSISPGRSCPSPAAIGQAWVIENVRIGISLSGIIRRFSTPPAKLSAGIASSISSPAPVAACSAGCWQTAVL